jgi:prephenate dehydrogenase
MAHRRKRQAPFNRITIIGVGLIGGSLALALKEKFPALHVTGVDTPAVLKRALRRKAIDRGDRSVERAVRSSDLVILATPISVIGKLLPRIARAVSPRTVVTDTGSVKHDLVKQADRLFPHGNFIGGHPMTGSEYSGINAAHPLLFQNALYLLTPSRASHRRSLNVLTRFISSLDARVLIMDASIHDSVVAAVSHLPQLAAVALMNTVGRRHAQARRHLALAAGGFRDMTRIASSPFAMWKDILQFNRKEIRASLQLYIQHLKRFASDLQSNRRMLSSEFLASRALRSRIPQSMKGFLSALVDVAIFIEDKPGELARLTGLLAKQKINIKDMELLKVREGRGGTFRLSFENRAVATEAVRILRSGGFGVEGKW